MAFLNFHSEGVNLASVARLFHVLAPWKEKDVMISKCYIMVIFNSDQNKCWEEGGWFLGFHIGERPLLKIL